MEIAKYLEYKKAGTARILDIEGQIHLSYKTHDEATGQPKPQLVPLNKEELEKMRETTAVQLQSIDELIKDIGAATKV